ncbi:MAG: VWA domain-containing protein [Thermoanaerobacteraceae bacterium]|nr:VWA domain-containing protein [Thermoanaerobacteraceae bacterium]
MPVDPVTRAVLLLEGEGNHSLPRNLVRFIHILRHLGMRISTAETLDACQALLEVDLLDREQVRAALGALLVKSRAERQIFTMAFDRFFVPPEEKERRRRERRQLLDREEARLEDARKELQEALAPWGTEINFTGEEVHTFAGIPRKERQRLLELVRQMRGNPVNNPGAMIGRIMQSALNYWRYYLLKTRGEEGRRELEAELTGEEDMDDVIDGVAADFYRHPEDRLLYQDMQQIADENLERATRIIQHLSDQLAHRLSRRYHQSRKRQVVDIRRTIRRNIPCGGTPLKLSYRSRRTHRPRLVLVCDVSASMARYARFVLQFIYGLSSAVQNIESFVFSEDLERVTPGFRQGRGFVQTMTDMINTSRQWGRTTNLGRALSSLRHNHGSVLTGDTIFIIVSDTKTISPREAAGELEAIRRRVKDILWLNTVPRREWSTLPGVAAFAPLVQMFECHTLAHLEGIFRRQMLKHSR